MDRFDEIWKNRFNEGDTPIADWNMPDDDLVWEGIAPHIPKNENRSKIGWLWWGLGLIVMLLLAYLAINQGNASTSLVSEHQGRVLKIQNANANSAFEIKSKDASINSKENLDVVAELDGSKSKPSKPNQILEKLNTNKYKNNTVLNNQQLEEKTFEKTVDNLNQLTSSDKENLLLITKKEIVEQQENQISDFRRKINIDPLVMLKLDNIQTQSNLSPKKIDKESKEKVLEIQTIWSVGAVLWQHQISDQYTSDLSPFDFNYQDAWGWQANATLEVNLNNYFSPYIGFQYESVKVTSGHNSLLNYNLTGEQGGPSNDYTQTLATPYGLAEASFRFSRDENYAEEETALLVDFKSNHQIQNWSMPIGLKIYPIGKKTRFQPLANVGFGINYLSGIENIIDDINTNHTFIQYAPDAPQSFANPNLNQWHYDLRLGAGINYYVNKDFQIALQYNWSHGLNAVFQQGDYATRINRHQWSIGVVKNLQRR